MLHSSTQKLLLKLHDMTLDGAIAWKEADGDSVKLETEGYCVLVCPDPVGMELSTVKGRLLEKADEAILNDTKVDETRSFTDIITEIAQEGARYARGTEQAINAILGAAETGALSEGLDFPFRDAGEETGGNLDTPETAAMAAAVGDLAARLNSAEESADSGIEEPPAEEETVSEADAVAAPFSAEPITQESQPEAVSFEQEATGDTETAEAEPMIADESPAIAVETDEPPQAPLETEQTETAQELNAEQSADEPHRAEFSADQTESHIAETEAPAVELDDANVETSAESDLVSESEGPASEDAPVVEAVVSFGDSDVAPEPVSEETSTSVETVEETVSTTFEASPAEDTVVHTKNATTEVIADDPPAPPQVEMVATEGSPHTEAEADDGVPPPPHDFLLSAEAAEASRHPELEQQSSATEEDLPAPPADPEETPAPAPAQQQPQPGGVPTPPSMPIRSASAKTPSPVGFQQPVFEPKTETPPAASEGLKKVTALGFALGRHSGSTVRGIPNDIEQRANDRGKASNGDAGANGAYKPWG